MVDSEKLQTFVKDIPNINTYPLTYVFESTQGLQLKQKPDTLWLEFGVASGRTINYISKFLNDDEKIFGFDSFLGLPEKWRDGFGQGMFTLNGDLPLVNKNVELIKGWFNETLEEFLLSKNKKISFVHIDCDLYSSTKYVLSTMENYLDDDCIFVFDELVNYPGYDGDNGELRAFYEFISENENELSYEWIGMDGTIGMFGYYHENVAVRILKKSNI